MFDEITKKMFMMGVTGFCVLFALALLIAPDEDGIGMFGDVGKVTNSAITPEATYKEENAFMIEELSTEEAPKVTYNKKALTLGMDEKFEDLFSLSEEGKIYLVDIRSTQGSSQVEWHTQESYGTLEELSAAFYYIEESDTLIPMKAGVYTMMVRAYGENGKSALYEFLLPVEVD